MKAFGRVGRLACLPAVAVAMVVGPAMAGGGPVLGAVAPRAVSDAAWQQAIAQAPAPGGGCFHASYPALVWHATPCAVPPTWPMEPALPAGAPAAVGDGHDYSARVAGRIRTATGSFHKVSPGITEKGKVDNEGAPHPNTFTLQLNTEFFSSPTCAGSADPSTCLGWQQFVYETSSNMVFMQYWLIDYDATCPTHWFTYQSDCYVNSDASVNAGSPVTAPALATTKLQGQAVRGGDDTVVLLTGGTQAALVAAPDGVLDLAQRWNTAEFAVVGDAGGGEATFGPDSTLEAETAVKGSGTAAPTCVHEGFTGETNNLDLSGTPPLGRRAVPTIGSEQTDATATARSCAAVPGT